MNNLIITLLSEKPCEINRFLSSYYKKDMKISDESFMWYSLSQNNLDKINILATLIDNNEDYKIKALISINHYDSILVTKDNLNDLIKVLYLMNF